MKRQKLMLESETWLEKSYLKHIVEEGNTWTVGVIK